MRELFADVPASATSQGAIIDPDGEPLHDNEREQSGAGQERRQPGAYTSKPPRSNPWRLRYRPA